MTLIPLGGKKALGQASSVDLAEVARLKQFGRDLKETYKLPMAEQPKAIREAYVRMYPRLKAAMEEYEKIHLTPKPKAVA